MTNTTKANTDNKGKLAYHACLAAPVRQGFCKEHPATRTTQEWKRSRYSLTAHIKIAAPLTIFWLRDKSYPDRKNTRPRFAWLIGARYTLPPAIYVPASGSEYSELAFRSGNAPLRQSGSSLSRSQGRDLRLGPLYCRVVSAH
jgi:hypothetical protein